MLKLTLVASMLAFTSCSHFQSYQTVDSKREPAQFETQSVSFLCQHSTSGEDRESFKISPSGEVKYELATKGLPMEGRGPISANWISQNVVTLTGRWFSDMVCGPPSSCQFRYFTIFLHKKGTGLEVTTYFRTPEGAWRSDSKPIICTVGQ